MESVTQMFSFCTNSSGYVISFSKFPRSILQRASAFPFALPRRCFILKSKKANSAAHFCSTASNLAHWRRLKGYCLCNITTTFSFPSVAAHEVQSPLQEVPAPWCPTSLCKLVQTVPLRFWGRIHCLHWPQQGSWMIHCNMPFSSNTLSHWFSNVIVSSLFSLEGWVFSCLSCRSGGN